MRRLLGGRSSLTKNLVLFLPYVTRTCYIAYCPRFYDRTTPMSVLAGLERLKLPPAIVGITGFMLRYVDVVLGQFGRMRRAMESRAYRPRSLRQSRPMAAATGALFVRSFERGERVFLAMTARGYTGNFPSSGARAATTRVWLAAAGVLAAIWSIVTVAWLVR